MSVRRTVHTSYIHIHMMCVCFVFCAHSTPAAAASVYEYEKENGEHFPTYARCMYRAILYVVRVGIAATKNTMCSILHIYRI